jgi:Xaa-Pro aminopeptidase
MTRTLFIGEPSARDMGLYETVAAAQASVISALRAAAEAGVQLPDGRAMDALARGVIEADGRWAPYGHGLGHGIGLATHEEPSLSRRAPETPLPGETVFSVEPGIYLEGETGVRIEDLVHVDVPLRTLRELTRFPKEPLVLPA